MFASQITTLRVALHPAVAPYAPEAKYALRVMLRLAGYGQQFVWADTSASQQAADIYYGPPGWLGTATCRITWCGQSLTDAGAVEPRGLRQLDDLPFLDFGEPEPGIRRAAEGQMQFGSDVVLAAFWLLSGARERHYRRDGYDNFHLDGSALLSSGVLEQPLVSIYADFFRRYFSARGKSPASLPWAGAGHRAAFIFSHDVDYPEIIRAIEFLRVLGGRAHAPRRVLGGVLSGANHFWRFADWVEFVRRYGAHPAFNFSARRGSLAQYAAGTPDCFYDIRSPRFRELFRCLRDQGCEIALHASYHAFKDAGQLRREKESLEQAAGVRVEGGRHHYWRLNPQAPHETLAHHQQMGMAYDSSLAFEFYPGFRRGVCHPFRPFDPRTRRELQIVELPPTWMDDHFDRRLAKNGLADPAAPHPEIAERTTAHARRLLDAVRSTGGVAMVDYHVRGMNADFFPRYGPWLTRFAQKHFDSSLTFTMPRELAKDYASYIGALDAASTDGCVERSPVLDRHSSSDAMRRARAQRIAVITLEGSAYGLQLLRALAAQRLPVSLVIVVANTWRRKWRLLRGVARRIGWVDAGLYAIEEIWATRTAPENPGPGYAKLAARVIHVGSVRDPRLPSLLREDATDIVLLGQSGIIPKEVLAAPRVGTLNAHPGMLPDYRGIDCALWAVLRDECDRVGSSLHWVDAGIDTGAIVRRAEYRWRGDETAPVLAERLYDDCISLLVEATAQLRTESLEAAPNRGGTQHYKMPRRQRREAIRKLAELATQPSRAQCRTESQ